MTREMGPTSARPAFIHPFRTCIRQQSEARPRSVHPRLRSRLRSLPVREEETLDAMSSVLDRFICVFFLFLYPYSFSSFRTHMPYVSTLACVAHIHICSVGAVRVIDDALPATLAHSPVVYRKCWVYPRQQRVAIREPWYITCGALWMIMIINYSLLGQCR